MTKVSGWLTEKDAKREDCPHFTEPAFGDGITVSTQHIVYVPIKCKASECRMAWRWANASDMPNRGYCGLSGKPEY